jgi:hypothetical protein
MLDEIGLTRPFRRSAARSNIWTSGSRRDPSTSYTCASPWTTATTRSRPSGR